MQRRFLRRCLSLFPPMLFFCCCDDPCSCNDALFATMLQLFVANHALLRNASSFVCPINGLLFSRFYCTHFISMLSYYNMHTHLKLPEIILTIPNGAWLPTVPGLWALARKYRLQRHHTVCSCKKENNSWGTHSDFLSSAKYVGNQCLFVFTIIFMKPLTLSSFFHYGRPIYLWKDCMWLVVSFFAVGFALSLIFSLFFGLSFDHSIVACLVVVDTIQLLLVLCCCCLWVLLPQIRLVPISRITEEVDFSLIVGLHWCLLLELRWLCAFFGTWFFLTQLFVNCSRGTIRYSSLKNWHSNFK